MAILQQAKEVSFTPALFGNEITGNAAGSAGERRNLFEGLLFAEPELDVREPRTKAFIERFKKRFKVEALPYGFWSAQAYDAVVLLATTIGRCGERVAKVRECLLEVKDYEGVSGRILINQDGDGVRNYLLKRISNGSPERLEQ